MTTTNLHDRCLNVRRERQQRPHTPFGLGYLDGHRDARHACAEIAAEGDARIAELERQLADVSERGEALADLCNALATGPETQMSRFVARSLEAIASIWTGQKPGEITAFDRKLDQQLALANAVIEPLGPPSQLLQDGDGHWYVVPVVDAPDVRELLECADADYESVTDAGWRTLDRYRIDSPFSLAFRDIDDTRRAVHQPRDQRQGEATNG